MSLLDQKSGGTTGTVAGKFSSATVGIIELNRALRPDTGRRIDQDPAVGAHAGMPVADRPRHLRMVSLGNCRAPGEQEIVLGAMRLGKRDLHDLTGST